jgi:hypothetical protein
MIGIHWRESFINWTRRVIRNLVLRSAKLNVCDRPQPDVPFACHPLKLFSKFERRTENACCQSLSNFEKSFRGWQEMQALNSSISLIPEQWENDPRKPDARGWRSEFQEPRRGFVAFPREIVALSLNQVGHCHAFIAGRSPRQGDRFLRSVVLRIMW